MKHIRCRHCQSLETKRFGTYQVGVKKKKYLKQRFLCLSCKRSFTIKKTRNVSPALAASLTRDSIEGRSSIRTIARRKHLSKTTVFQAVHQTVKDVKDSIWIARNLKPQWGHVLSIDAKFVRVFQPKTNQIFVSVWEKKWVLKKAWIVGVDVLTKDLPHYEVFEGETKIDLYTFFKTLKRDVGYQLKVLVCDGNLETLETARMVYGKRIGIQLCVRHFIHGLKSYVLEEKARKRTETEMLVGSMWAALGMKKEEECLSTLKTLSRVRETRSQRGIQESLTDHLSLLTTHFRFHNRYYVPRYNNDVENLFKQVNLRLKSLNMFRNKQNAQEYLKAWALMRRCTKFTDCRGDYNRLRNGHAPLELAGVDLTDFDYLRDT